MPDDMKKVLVTGASRGIGKTISQKFINRHRCGWVIS